MGPPPSEENQNYATQNCATLKTKIRDPELNDEAKTGQSVASNHSRHITFFSQQQGSDSNLVNFSDRYTLLINILGNYSEFRRYFLQISLEKLHIDEYNSLLLIVFIVLLRIYISGILSFINLNEIIRGGACDSRYPFEPCGMYPPRHDHNHLCNHLRVNLLSNIDVLSYRIIIPQLST